MKAFKYFLSFLFCILYLYFPVDAQNNSPLTIAQIMQGEDFVGHLPKNIHWSEDGNSVFFNWNPDGNKLESLYKVDLRGLKPEKVSLQDRKRLPAFTGHYTHDFSLKTYEKDGDIFQLTIKTGQILQITNTIEKEFNPVYVNNETAIVYQKGNNLFSWSRADGSTKQLTNFVSGKHDLQDTVSLHNQWLENEEMNMFGILRERKERADLKKNEEEQLSPVRPKKISLEGQSIWSLRISPDGKYAVYVLLRPPSDSLKTKVPDYVSESGYVKIQNARPKVGSPQPEYHLLVYDLQKDSVMFVPQSQIPGIYDKPAFLKDYVPAGSDFIGRYNNPRPVIYLSPYFNQKGDKAFIEIRAIDNKDRWFMSIDLAGGSLKLVDRQHDDAWIGGPGIQEWIVEPGNTGWINNNTIWFQSEESGYSHIYTVNLLTGDKKQLTSGNWEVYKARLSRDKKYFYIAANKEGPAERHFYRLTIENKKLIKITTRPGKYDVEISPDEKMLAIRYSYSNKPWELYLMPNKPDAEMELITHSTTKAFEAYSWRDPLIIHFASRNGDTLAARLYRPDHPADRGPAVIFVHGAGYLQNVHKWWSDYFREYMFHNILADNGYTVLDIDYHGSEGYGRDWRTSVYRHMGGKDLSDQIDGAGYLSEHCHIDRQRIGIYGGSYGGFITLFAMFKSPDTFKCGAALRSVTDWAHYNHEYTSNRLNTPVDDSLAFKRSSPIYFANGLKGELLMLHGVIDSNVEFQDVVRLSQKLIELGKDNWSLALFPLEDHGFKEASSWTDEYKRIFELFERNLR